MPKSRMRLVRLLRKLSNAMMFEAENGSKNQDLLQNRVWFRFYASSASIFKPKRSNVALFTFN
jgi:hypothetical protein